MAERIELEIKGVKVIHFPADEPILARWAVERVIHMIPEAVKHMVIVDYLQIGPDIFQPLKDWYHQRLESQGIGFQDDLAPDDHLYLR